MKKILLLTLALMGLFTVSAFAQNINDGDANIEVGVEVEETCAVTFTNDTDSAEWEGDDLTVAAANDITAPDPTIEDYLNGSYTHADSTNWMMWWTNHATQINFDVDVTYTGLGTPGSTVLENSTINFVGPESYGSAGFKTIAAGTGTLQTTGYTLSDIDLDGGSPNYMPPGTYEVTFTIECDTP
jgi:hypothetical protein